MTTIKQVYEAEPLPCDVKPTSDEYLALNERMNVMQVELEQMLSRENMDKVYEYLNVVHQVLDLEKEALFTKGFSMGQTLAFESMANCKNKEFIEVQ